MELPASPLDSASALVQKVYGLLLEAHGTRERLIAMQPVDQAEEAERQLYLGLVSSFESSLYRAMQEALSTLKQTRGDAAEAWAKRQLGSLEKPCLLDALEAAYKNDSRRSVATLAFRLAPLRGALGYLRAVGVRGSHVERYKTERRAEKKAPATVNRELAALRRAFKLAVEQERLTAMPTIKLFREDNVREGFVTPADFETLVGKLPDYLQDFTRFAFLTGWRKGELRTLAWSDIDRDGGTATLRAANSKNSEARTLPLVGELAALIERRWAAREIQGAEGAVVTLSPLVFHRAGEPVGDFRKA